MEIQEGPLVVETLSTETKTDKPTFFEDSTVPPLAKAEPELDDNAVRAAIARAESTGMDPESLKMSDLSQPQAQETAPAKTEVPEKFLKPDGEVDVEKLKTSTKQLGEALKAKEEAVQKTVDDYLKDYKEMEAKFRAAPNPERLAQELPKAPAQEVMPSMTEEQLRQRLAKDLEMDPIGTMTGLIDVIVSKKMSPVTQDIEMVREERRNNTIRENIAKIAKSDPRILQSDIYGAVNQKLKEEPELWNLKNPHQIAWLKVKEELRLGEFQTQTAQPSKIPSPVLGGGSPASAPSSQASGTRDKISSLDQLDLRNKKHEEAGDEFIKSLLSKGR